MVPVEIMGNAVLEHAQLQVRYWREAQRGTAMSVHQRYRQALDRLREDARSVRLPRPVGLRLVEMGFVTTEEVEKALEQQRQASSSMLLGEILVQRGSVQPEDLFTVLHGAFEPVQQSSESAAHG
jgi:hypothetical protein